MLTEERRKKIIALLDQHSILKSQDLISLLNASESTIRRDLQELENAGLLERVHGGAKRPQYLEQELGMAEKSFKNVQQKQAIARLAADYVADGDVIYLDAGTTTLEMIPFLKGKAITAVTNSVGLAARLVEQEINTIVLGGRIKLTTDAVLGTQATDQLANYRFNKAFMGMNGVHVEHGFTTPDTEEALLKRLAMDHAQEAFVLVDYSKFNQVSFSRVAQLEAGTILTDKCPLLIYDKIKELTTIKEVTV
ncbi:DeoR/GlpR transcriptional regulator [Enterococcus sp. 669A]|uniref:DeoR/GlpR transcriptional regulator n=1 Tax=Candidatus Enterococcus moelleringii TaxID=2815325 RepID=A0ABS3L772_9ENTE|nr:DeoR/GlpR family DNA-binding transcription regulator [Enterococcus sp. 669A]MBO1305473.1 DeoR/GlpR transcriptional regulator [Enterococcus sp. 669A]